MSAKGDKLTALYIANIGIIPTYILKSIPIDNNWGVKFRMPIYRKDFRYFWPVLIRMKYKFSLLLVFIITAIVLLSNSCKKDNNDQLSYFLTNGPWSLASQQVFHFVGDTLKRTDTINLACTQKVTFNKDNTSQYLNYNCTSNSGNGKWQLNTDNLTLQSPIIFGKDTLFNNAQIINLGQYSLVLQTGSTGAFYTSKTVRQITRYGFIHQ